MTIEIDSQFPGGNIVVEDISGDQVRLHQDLRDSAHDWFYWCFRVRGAAGRTLTFAFTRSPALGVRGPAMSLDDGRTWRWLGADIVAGNTFTHTFPTDARDIRLSFGMPYQETAWDRFMADLGDQPLLSRHRLCVSEQRREVEYQVLGCPHTEPLHRVVITSRHHCCEMMTSYALEGLVGWALQDHSPAARWLRDNVQLFIVPFVDLDGVEAGDQGKGRQPRDHNRDYDGDSVHATTAALRAQLPGWGGGRLRVALDLHCPHIAGPRNEVIYQVGSSDDRIAVAQQRFGAVIESEATGALPFDAAQFLAFGEDWNTAENHAGGKSFVRWASEIAGMDLATTLELPYANAGGVEVNQATARSFGADLARALTRYLGTL